MIRSHMANITQTAVATASKIIEHHGRRMSAQTVQNRLKAVGLRAKRPYVGTYITISDRNRCRLELPRRQLGTTRVGHGWANFIQRLRKLPRRRYLAELRRDIVNVWNNFPQRLLRKCTNSTQHRLITVKTANGVHTRY